MPGQRAKNKVYFGGYISRDLHQQIVSLAKSEGVIHNNFGFAVKLILEALASRHPNSPQNEQSPTTVPEQRRPVSVSLGL